MINNYTRQLSLVLIFISFLAFANAQTVIPNNFYGINSWMPDTLNTSFYNGQVHNLWTETEAAKPAVIRIGGIAYDINYPTDFQLIKMIDSIQAIGAEPIVQVPLWASTKTAQNAADIVTLVNVTYGRNVKYFAIGNEPYLSYNAPWYGFSAGNYLPWQYARDVKDFSVAMKTVDANIKIIAGELTNYFWADSLINPGGVSDISGNNGTFDYIDMLSVHAYPFDSTQTRNNVVNSFGNYETRFSKIITDIDNANTTHSRINDLTFGVTELNVCWRNSKINNTIDGVHNAGFLAGQWWSNMLMTGLKVGVDMMCFWSIAEGGDGSSTDHGFISHTTHTLRPSYHQFQAMTNYFVGNFYEATPNVTDVVAGASKNGRDGWAIVIHNFNEITDYSLRLRLNTDAISGSETLKINVDGNIANEMTETITANSTTILFLSPNGWYRGKLVYDINAAWNNEGFEYTAHNPTRAKQIFAHYLPWYDNGTGGYGREGWCHDYNLNDAIDECTGTTQKSSIYEPIIGEYSQFDNEVLKYHIRLAQAAHIDGFMINVNPDWSFQWEVFNNVCQAALELNQCSDSDFKIIMSYDNSSDSDLPSIIHNFQEVYDSLYGKAAYTDLIFRDDVTNKPLLVVWSESSWSNYQLAIDSVFGVDSVIVMGRNAVQFDYHDGVFGWVAGLTNDPNNTTEWGESYLDGMSWVPARQMDFGLSNIRNANLLKLGGVWPGFDDSLVPTYWNGGTARYMNRNVTDGNTLELTWDKQINYTPLQLGGEIAVDNPWVQLITWNDFPEGTAIEPTRINQDFGFEALEICRTKGAIFKGETANDSLGILAAYEIYEAIQDNRQDDADSASVYFCDEDYPTAYAFAKFGNPALPVELVYFLAKANAKNVVLNWEVASFENHSHFEVQHSIDGRNFETIGTSYLIQSFYQFTHENPVSGDNYYRLKIVDNDDFFTFSKVEIVKFIDLESQVKIYQNGEKLMIDNQVFDGNVELKIYNTLGQVIGNQIINIRKKDLFELNLNIDKGIYIVELVQDNKRIVERIFWN